jgi:hypothetical protein
MVAASCSRASCLHQAGSATFAIGFQHGFKWRGLSAAGSQGQDVWAECDSDSETCSIPGWAKLNKLRVELSSEATARNSERVPHVSVSLHSPRNALIAAVMLCGWVNAGENCGCELTIANSSFVKGTRTRGI